jgi:hypothetical protein
MGTIANRRSPRRVFKRPVGVLLHGEYRVCQAHQLGEGGALVTIEGDIPRGTKVVISIFVPGGGFALIQAEVLYKVGAGYGVRFAQLPLAQKRFIRNYVSAKTQEEAEDEMSLPAPEMKKAEGFIPSAPHKLKS